MCDDKFVTQLATNVKAFKKVSDKLAATPLIILEIKYLKQLNHSFESRLKAKYYKLQQFKFTFLIVFFVLWARECLG